MKLGFLGPHMGKHRSALLIHVEYCISLPDLGWTIVELHSLIPFVYACIEIGLVTSENPQAVSYCGPTFIAIRNEKHSASSVTHAQNFEMFLIITIFLRELFCTKWSFGKILSLNLLECTCRNLEMSGSIWTTDNKAGEPELPGDQEIKLCVRTCLGKSVFIKVMRCKRWNSLYITKKS